MGLAQEILVSLSQGLAQCSVLSESRTSAGF